MENRSEAETVLATTADGIATITLNRPDKRNALDVATTVALCRALREAEADPEVRVVLLRGAGASFCAGRDLKETDDAGILAAIQEVARLVFLGTRPVVAAVQGWAVGGGLELALACDLVLAAEDARFRLPEAGLGYPLTGGATALLSAVVGLHRAKAMVLSTEPVDAAAMQAAGVVWRIVPGAALDREAEQVARDIAARPPEAVAWLKRELNRPAREAFLTALDAESAAVLSGATGG